MPLQFAATGTVEASSTDVVDDFNRADSTTTLNTASDGNHVWTAQVGTWGISSNQGYCPTPSGGVGYATVDYGTRDCTVQVTIATLAKPFGLILAWEDSSNFIRVENFTIAGTSRTRIILRRSGSDQVFGTTDGIAWASGDVMKAVLSGQNVTVYRNGISVVVVSDSRFNDATGTEHGLYAGTGSSLRFDSFSIVP